MLAYQKQFFCTLHHIHIAFILTTNTNKVNSAYNNKIRIESENKNIHNFFFYTLLGEKKTKLCSSVVHVGSFRLFYNKNLSTMESSEKAMN